MIKTNYIAWHFESSVLNSQNGWAKLAGKLKKWDTDGYGSEYWFSEGLGQTRDEVLKNLDVCHRRISQSDTLASFLYIRPTVRSICELKELSDQAAEQCCGAMVDLTKRLIETFFYKPADYSFRIRLHKATVDSFLFSAVIFSGDVWWRAEYSLPASLHPNPHIMNAEKRQSSTGLVREIFPPNFLRTTG